jgi:parvulin-like peptidyl-prolyl cis-trans isomerase-like protein
MRLRFLVLAGLLAAVAAAGQTAKTSAPKPKTSQTTAKTPTAAATTPADHSEAVITIENLCPGKESGPQCRTVITKDRFEHLMKSVIPNLPPGARRQAAQQLAELLVLATDGEKMGLQNQEDVKDRIYLRRLQILGAAYGEYLKEHKAKVSEADAQKYYSENKEAYEEITLRRLFIPKPPQGGDKKPPLDETATKALADKMHERAAAGEDFDKLEQEVFTATTPEMAKSGVPPTSLGPRRRGLGVPPQHEAELFAMKPGQVSPVYDEPTSYVIFKVDANRTLPFDDVKTQIISTLEEQKFKDAMQETMSSVKTSLNDNYFKPPEKPATASKPPSATPTSTPAEPQSRPSEPAPAPAPSPSAGTSAAPK